MAMTSSVRPIVCCNKLEKRKELIDNTRNICYKVVTE